MNIITSSSFLILTLLVLPMAFSITNMKKHIFPNYVTSCIKYAILISLVTMTSFFNSGAELLSTDWQWITIGSVKLSLCLMFDLLSIVFLPVALYITWSIMKFSMWNMHSSPNLDRFIKYLLTFLITMVILTTANNRFQFFIVWEGVGIMSFLMIGWWYGRAKANTPTLQTILYNWIGDIGIMLAMAWFCTKNNSWELQQKFIMDNPSTIPFAGLLLAATGKSAQFNIHPWLPSAMESPTPISALLHWSTMVVAGVSLLTPTFLHYLE